MLKNLVDDTSFRERGSGMCAQEFGQLLRGSRFAVRQRAGETSWLSSAENWQQRCGQGARIAPHLHGRVEEFVFDGVLPQRIGRTQDEFPTLSFEILSERLRHNAIAEVEQQVCR